ncbi:hypothetical protein D3C72_2467360 [compost metagenome]
MGGKPYRPLVYEPEKRHYAGDEADYGCQRQRGIRAGQYEGGGAPHHGGRWFARRSQGLLSGVENHRFAGDEIG